MRIYRILSNIMVITYQGGQCFKVSFGDITLAFDPISKKSKLEAVKPDPEEEAMLAKLDAVKWDMLEEWSRTKKAPQHAAWLHAKELNKH